MDLSVLVESFGPHKCVCHAMARGDELRLAFDWIRSGKHQGLAEIGRALLTVEAQHEPKNVHLHGVACFAIRSLPFDDYGFEFAACADVLMERVDFDPRVESNTERDRARGKKG